MGDWSGTVPTILAGDNPSGDDWKNVLDELSAISTAWTAWTPTLGNLTLGNGTLAAVYRRVGKTLDYRFKFTLGSTSAVGSGPTFTLPTGATLNSGIAVNVDEVGMAVLTDTGVATRLGIVLPNSSTVLTIWSFSTTGVVTGISATVPHTWGSTDVISCHGTAELA